MSALTTATPDTLSLGLAVVDPLDLDAVWPDDLVTAYLRTWEQVETENPTWASVKATYPTWYDVLRAFDPVFDAVYPDPL